MIKLTSDLPYTLTLPGLIPPSWNKFYSQGHWGGRAKLAEAWHQHVWLAVRTAPEKLVLVYPKNGLSITITVYFPNARLIDADNVCSKLIIDGLVHADCIVNDTNEWVKEVTTSVRIDRENPRTEILIEPYVES
jgi:hypothetical protein